jgi:flagellin
LRNLSTHSFINVYRQSGWKDDDKVGLLEIGEKLIKCSRGAPMKAMGKVVPQPGDPQLTAQNATSCGQAPDAGTDSITNNQTRRIPMSLGVLNNISAIYAQNNLTSTQTSLSKTLQQLSSGSRINSGSDDAAGLSLANGLEASSTALSQSATNASEGVDFLQVADGALSQVTSLLNRAVTLATEASNGTLNTSQQSAADSEYQKILTEINTINDSTEYNGISTFSTSALTAADSSNAISVGTANSLTVTYSDGTTQTIDSTTGTGITDMASLASTISGLAGSNGESISASVSNGELIISGGSVSGTVTETDMAAATSGETSLTVSDATDALQISGTAGTDDLTINYTESDGTAATATLSAGTSYGSLSALASAINTAATGSSGSIATVSGNTLTLTDASLTTGAAGAITETADVSVTDNKSVSIFTSDGNISTSYNDAASDTVSTSTGSLSLSGTTLSDATSAQSALTAINAAITTVAADRGTIGANINTLTAVEDVMTTQSTNTLSAENDVTATDYGQATSDMSKYEILSQTGIAALAQANQSQQLITKLLQ